jgi:hypothetical protein
VFCDDVCRLGGDEEKRMCNVRYVAHWLSALEGKCTWNKFCCEVQANPLWIAGAPLMVMMTASAFRLLGVVEDPEPHWLPKKMAGSMELYRLACEADGFKVHINTTQFTSFLRDMSDRSEVSMSDLENMCCKLKVYGDQSGW